MKLTWTRALIVAVVAIAVVALVTIGRVVFAVMSIPDNKPTSPQETARATQNLLGRPSLEDTEARLRSVVEQIAAAGTELVPGMQWYWNGDREMGGCDKPYDDTEGRIAYLPDYVSNTPIPDAVWSAFLERVRPIAAQMGATAPTTMQNTHGNYEVWFSSPDDGTTIKVGSQAATVISGIVGCHLPRDKYDTTVRPTS
ncbi:hypothetical protein GZH49_35745 [Nocardia terpenica]|uniref:LppA family lipoprotein n=1 Tax=Nocardia terpenica TaxID=455432 RepID=UPI002FE27BC5